MSTLNIDPANLPTDVGALQRMVIKMAEDMQRFRLEYEKLKAQLHDHRRARFGKSSEQLDAREAQLELAIETLEESQAETLARLPVAIADMIEAQAPKKPARRALPDHLPSVEVRQPDLCACPKCGGGLRKVSEEKTQVLDYVQGYFRKQIQIRGSFSCKACDTIMQAPAPGGTITRGLATPALLAHVIVSKFADHCPLYRQARIAQRQGVELSDSTMCGWMGGASVAAEPLVMGMWDDLMTSSHLHADETPIPVLAPGAGKTRQGYFWVVVRDESDWSGARAPCVFFRFAPDRKGERANEVLGRFNGVLHVDGYAGYNRLFDTGHVTAANCWAHARREFFKEAESTKSTIAGEALDRIGQLYGIERQIRGLPPDERLRIRQLKSRPIAEDLKTWAEREKARLPRKSDLAEAFNYMLGRWSNLSYYLSDGSAAIDNNPVERAIRGSALGRKNHLFMGSERGGARAAIFYSLIETCRLNDVNPYAYLADVLARINDHPAKRIDELFPWNWKRNAMRAAA